MIESHWEDRGFICFISRNETFDTLNGYIVVPNTHPWCGKHYDDIQADIHGGLTFSQDVNGYWIVGFDTNHAGDAYGPNAGIGVMTGTPVSFLSHGTYRDSDYVKSELDFLVDQALRAGPGFNLEMRAKALLGVGGGAF